MTTSCECICVLQVGEFDICFYASTEIASVLKCQLGCVTRSCGRVGTLYCIPFRCMCFFDVSVCADMRYVLSVCESVIVYKILQKCYEIIDRGLISN